MREIPMPPDNRTVALEPTLDAARNDGGLRIALASAMARKDDPPGAETQIGGFVYEIADRVAREVERRDRAVKARGLREAAVAAELKPGSPWVHVAGWLRRLADQIEQGGADV